MGDVQLVSFPWQPRLGARCEQSFEETFQMAFTYVRIHSGWIRSFLGSTETEPLTEKLKSANVQCSIAPGDIKYRGGSGKAMAGGGRRGDDFDRFMGLTWSSPLVCCSGISQNGISISPDRQ